MRHATPAKTTRVTTNPILDALANCTLCEMVQVVADIYGRYDGGAEW